jgi:tetratricopeptide (TPR) repeat protein
MNKHKSANQNRLIISISVIAIILASYWQVQNYGFISYDDQLYIVDNYRIHSGFTFKSVVDALTNVHTGHWHPLTIMSHMLDWNLFGDNAGGHHWTSVIIHILNAVLLFLFFQYLTGAIWKSAFIAALFAIHPINVESVAWIAERKNVLSTFFWILTMFLYVWYVRSPSWKRYLPMFLCFALGLMAKPMLVTLPFVLLLLDYWPLNRTIINQQNKNQAEIPEPISLKKYKITSLIWEKVPLLFLTAISICLTFYAAKSVGTIVGLGNMPLTKRIGNTIFYYALYLKKLFWPIDLAVFYPLYSEIPIWQIAIAVLLLGGISILVFLYSRQHPYLLVGWFWYLGTLVPVIGIVQVGNQSIADRYAYVPFIGLFIIIAWGGYQVSSKIRYAKVLTALVATFIVMMFAAATYSQVKVWKNSVTLFEDALKSNPDNYLAYNVLGLEAVNRGEHELALSYYYMALKINPRFDPAYNNTGNLLIKMGRPYDAIRNYEKALKINKMSVEAHYNLGVALLQENYLEGAIAHFREAVELRRDYVEAHNNWGVALMKMGNIQKAVAHFKEALRLNPRHPEALKNIKNAISMQKKINENISPQ